MKKIKLACAVAVTILGLTACGGPSNEEIFSEVYTALNSRSYSQAVEALSQIEITRSNRQEYYRLQGIACIGMGQYAEAVTALETALSYNNGFLNETDYDINKYLAAAYLHTGQYEDAEHVYASMEALKTKDADVYYEHGVTLMYLDRYEEAKEAFDSAVTLNPDDYDQIIDIFEVLSQFGYREPGMEYVQAVMDEEASMDAYDRGRILYHTGQYNLAVSALEQADKKANPDVLLYLGMSYEALGDYNYAVNVYKEALLTAESTALYNQLGLCQMKRAAYSDALEAFEAGLKLEDNTYRQDLRYNEIIANEFIADFAKAKTLMEAYLKDYPSDTTAQREYEFLKTR